MKAGIHLALAAAVTSVDAGCSTTTGDFKSEGEKFLESPDLAAEAGYTFSDALCQEPPSVAPGTRYSCTAVDNDGDQWEFVVEITGERALTFVSGEVIG
ncbi:MAG: hypothetical protein ACKOBT_08850 [Actinomycetota bacterium]